jgi:parallel beta-helix repeat protein
MLRNIQVQWCSLERSQELADLFDRQINGARGLAPPTSGGANIEFGGGNRNQTIQYVKSFDPRGWSCLHIMEGPLTCTNSLVQNNDIGPCGVDTFQEWADGISVSCRDSIVRNNMIKGPTDGGIVLFGSPGTQVYNNTIWITNVIMNVYPRVHRVLILFPEYPAWRHQYGRLFALERRLHRHCCPE